MNTSLQKNHKTPFTHSVAIGKKCELRILFIGDILKITEYDFSSATLTAIGEYIKGSEACEDFYRERGELIVYGIDTMYIERVHELIHHALEECGFSDITIRE